MRRIAGEALDPDFLEFLLSEAGVTAAARACVLKFHGFQNQEPAKRVARTARELGISRRAVYQHLQNAEAAMRSVLDEWRREREDEERPLLEELIREIIPNLPRINPPSPIFQPNTYGEMERVRMPKANFPTAEDVQGHNRAWYRNQPAPKGEE